MYETSFALAERPFASVPRVDHFYPAAVIEAARLALTRCLDRGEGAALVIGPSGTGKSLLCQVLAEQLQKSFQVALLASPHLDTRRALLQAVLYELNRPYRGMDEGELRLALVDYITLSDECGRGVVLLVDEAHHLPLRLLDEIRALTNLTRDRQPAVRLVLAGSHALEERFASPKLESFSQRISARCYLESFQRSETQGYIQARISACGGRGEEIFPAQTCQMVHKATDGVPRLINQVCDHALLLAYAAGIRRIEPVHVEEAWADLQQLPTPWNAPAAPAEAGGGVIEFGGLDDDPVEMSSIAGKFPVAEETATAYSPAMQPTLVAETTGDPDAVQDAESAEGPNAFEQLQQIQQLLADVKAEFQPAATIGPEVELTFGAHPFEEAFEEEEVIADRYAAAVPPPAASAVALAKAPEAAINCITAERDEYVPATAEDDEFAAPAAVDALPAFRRTAAQVPRTSAFPCQTSSNQDWPEARESAAAVAVAEEEPPPRPKRPAVPPPRKEFGRLFANLRRGL